MARQEVNIGVEGNDGTGDSIRASFKKVNENFIELYAVFGLGGRIEFTTLSDTPDIRPVNSIPIVNSIGDFIDLAKLETDDSGSIQFEFIDGTYDEDGNYIQGSLIIKSGFSRLADDTSPKLGNHLYAGTGPWIIAGNYVPTEIDDPALEEFNVLHETNITPDNVAITKQYADLSYISKNTAIKIKDEPNGIAHYTWEIADYVSAGDLIGSVRIDSYRDPYTQNEIVAGHGLDSSSNGLEVVFTAQETVPTPLEGLTSFYIRIVNVNHLRFYADKNLATAQTDNPIGYIDLSANIEIGPNDSHTITVASLDLTLSGNFLADQAVPRKSVVLRGGDTMTGALFLSDHPGDLVGSGTPNGPEDLQAATKLYVDQGAAHSSPEVLFVSTTGDDTMQGVPAGKEGSAAAYAFATIGAAAKRADELIRTADSTPGPYMQKLTYTNNNQTFDTYVLDSFVEGGTQNGGYNEPSRTLLALNRKYIQKETIAWVDKTYPNFSYDKSYCERDIGLLVDAIRFDLYRGITTNTLTYQAAERYYSSVSGRRAITIQQNETVAAIEFAKGLSINILQQQLQHRQIVLSIGLSNPGIVTVSSVVDTEYQDGDLIVFKDIPDTHPMSVLNGQTFYIKLSNEEPIQSFTLYSDELLLEPYSTSNIAEAYTNVNADQAAFGKVYQQEEPQIYDESFIDSTVNLTPEINAVTEKWTLIQDVIKDIDDPNLPDIVYGNVYQILTKNKNISYLDQTADVNADALPGKVIRGKNSQAIGRIVEFINPTDNTYGLIDPITGEAEDRPTVFSIHLLSARDFEVGEKLEYANYIKKKEVVIRVEAGNYYEDYPIKIPQNVSLKGDEFRRVIIQPKTEKGSYQPRISQSKWASTYFYRDSYFDGLTLTENGTSQFINQLGESQGWFGYHYLTDPSQPLNVNNGVVITNPIGNVNAARILEKNKDFFDAEIILHINTTLPGITYDPEKIKKDLAYINDGLAHDFTYGGEEMTLEVQGSYFGSDTEHATTVINYTDQEAATISAMEKFRDLAEILLNGSVPTYSNTTEAPVILRNDIGQQIAGENNTADNVVKMVNKIIFVFDSANYNPPKRTDEPDVFLLGDTTIIRNVTCRGHGGFMCVLDPTGQILTKSPYTQTASSFSRSLNKQVFSGGMFVDAFVGNLPITITNDARNTEYKLYVSSNAGEGLFIRIPELPCPFYRDGIRYQVNAVSNYDQSLGTAIIYLDKTSGNGAGFTEVVPAQGVDIFLQTAGNRSLLANDFTQVNDLGYGLVVTNGAFSEQVSMFTYYCHVAYYSKNGAEIRSLNGSNGYGNFALVSEGADPNEIPDQVLLKSTMTRPAKIYAGTGSTSGATYTANEGNSFIIVYDMPVPPQPQSLITIDHNGTANAEGETFDVLHYRVVSVSSITALTGDFANIGTPIDTILYRLELRSDEIIQDDYFGLLATDLVAGQLIDYADNIQLTFTGVAAPERLATRPSTAINFDESDEITYRSLDFQTEDPYGNILPNDEVRATIEQNFDFIELIPYHAKTGNEYNQSGDTWMAIEPLSEGGTYTDDIRIVDPASPKIFSYKGKSHRVTKYAKVQTITQLGANVNVIKGNTITQGNGFTATVAYINAGGSDIEIYDVTGTYDNTADIFINGVAQNNTADPSAAISFTDWAIIEFVDEFDITGMLVTGLSANIDTSDEYIFAGLAENATAEITVAISLLRATGHDFTQIGTGGYNTSNYPNVILGDPIIPLTDVYWTNEPDGQSSAQVWEKRKGRVFWVSTDQYGFFRVGRFFSVDQGTGAITFSGEVGISNANALGFKKGVTIDEFSADETMTDDSGSAVPTEKAIRSYIAQVLGTDPHTNPSFPGVGFLPLSGLATQPNPVEMIGNLGMGGNRIEDLANPINDDNAVNKRYVDQNIANFDSVAALKDFMPAQREIDNALGVPSPASEPKDIAANEIFISTGNYIIYLDLGYATGTFDDGVAIRNTADPAGATITGQIIQSYAYLDSGYGNLRKIVYSLDQTSPRPFDSNQEIKIYSGTYDSNSGTAASEGFLLKDTQTTLGVGGSYNEITNAVNGDASEFNDIIVTTVREEDSARIIFAIRENSIVNADVNSSAGILQSKLALNAATTRANSNGITQANLGVASFNSTEFNAASGWISVKDGGISLTKLASVASNVVLGRTDAGSGPVSAISFSTITSSGGALLKSNFTSNGVLLKTGADSWSTKSYVSSATGDTIALRDAQGNLAGNDLIFSNQVKYNQSGTIRDIFSSGGTGQIRVNSKTPTSTSIQPNTSIGYLAVNQVYTDGIASPNTNTSTPTGANIYLGNGGGSPNATANSIIFWSKGQDRYKINENSFEAFNAADLGSAANPFGTCYANVLSGYATKAKYADLAENYLADDEYFEGTVLVFGGDAEITVTNTKGDKRVAGIVSTNPAHLMNEALEGEHVTPLALQGRVPCKVIGKVAKGDMLVTSAIPGYAIVDNDPRIGTVLGKAVGEKTDDGKGVVEIVVGRL